MFPSNIDLRYVYWVSKLTLDFITDLLSSLSLDVLDFRKHLFRLRGWPYVVCLACHIWVCGGKAGYGIQCKHVLHYSEAGMEKKYMKVFFFIE